METLLQTSQAIGLTQVPMTRERLARSILNTAIYELFGPNEKFLPTMITQSSTIAVCALALDLLTDEDDIAYAQSRGGSLFDFLEFEKNEGGFETMAQASLTTQDLLRMMPSGKLESEYVDVTSDQVENSSKHVDLNKVSALKGPNNKHLRLVLSKDNLLDKNIIPLDSKVIHRYCNVTLAVVSIMHEVVLRQEGKRDIIFKTRTPQYHSSMTAV